MTENLKPRRDLKTRVAFAWRILREPTLDLASLEPSVLPVVPPTLAAGQSALHATTEVAGSSNELTLQQLDLKKLEYSGTAERYENIYKAVWQNFSYMAAVAAGILTFGAKQLPIGVLAWLALLPLVFWSFATFIPLDFYGRRARERLKKIEGSLNSFYFPGTMNEHRLSHFADFADAKPWWHVRTAVGIFSGVILIAWMGLTLWLGIFMYREHSWASFLGSLSHVAAEAHGTSVKIETYPP